MTYLRALGRSFLIINDQTVVLDLLDKRSALETRMIMLCELCGQSVQDISNHQRLTFGTDYGNLTPFMQLGSLHREHHMLQNQVLDR